MNILNINIKAKTRYLILFGAGILLFWFLYDAVKVRQSASDALRLCAASVIPSLFPFLIVSGLLASADCGKIFAPMLSGIMALYRLPGQAGSALALGFLGGYPVGARTAAELYKNGDLTRDEAERLLGFCNNANPAFLWNILGIGVFGDMRIGVWLLLIHILAAILTGLFFFRGKYNQNYKKSGREIPDSMNLTQNIKNIENIENINFFGALVESVSAAALTMLKICGFVIFFYILASPLRNISGITGIILTGFIDLFSVTPMFEANATGFILASALSGWGGCGVLFQTAAALDNSQLSIKNYISGKIAQGILSGLLALILSKYLF